MKKILVLLLLLGVVMGYSQDKKPKVLIIPFQNKVEQKYRAVENIQNIVQTLIFNSMYNFIAIVPSIDVPNKDILSAISFEEKNIASVFEKYQADIILYGDFSFTGSEMEPKANINYKVWLKGDSKPSITKKYLSSTGLEIFDTVDAIINDTVKEVLKSSINLASLQLKSLKTGTGVFDLVINDKVIETITNDNFSTTIKILAENDYRVKIIDKNKGTDEVVFEKSYSLKRGTETNITFESMGVINVAPVQNKGQAYQYKLYLNDLEISENSSVSNVLAYREHLFTILDNQSNVVYSNWVSVRGNEETNIVPSVNMKRNLYFQLSYNDVSLIGASADWFINPNMGVGLSAGYSSFSTGTNISFPILSFGMSLSYYIIGDYSTAFKLGLSGVARYNMSLLPTGDGYVELTNTYQALMGIPLQSFSASAGLYLLGELDLNALAGIPLGIVIKAGAEFDFGYMSLMNMWLGDTELPFIASIGIRF